jgi:hypothetical protein
MRPHLNNDGALTSAGGGGLRAPLKRASVSHHHGSRIPEQEEEIGLVVVRDTETDSMDDAMELRALLRTRQRNGGFQIHGSRSVMFWLSHLILRGR